MKTPFEFINSIQNCNSKDPFLENPEESHKNYNPFIINRGFSMNMDTVLIANEININHEINKHAQYLFYNHSVRPGKRYIAWHKKDKEDKNEKIKNIQILYNYSRKKAEEVCDLIDEEKIKEKIKKGGIEK